MSEKETRGKAGVARPVPPTAVTSSLPLWKRVLRNVALLSQLISPAPLAPLAVPTEAVWVEGSGEVIIGRGDAMRLAVGISPGAG